MKTFLPKAALQKIKKTVPGAIVIIELNDEEIIEKFYDEKLEKSNKIYFRVEKVISKLDEKPEDNDKNVKWKI